MSSNPWQCAATRASDASQRASRRDDAAKITAEAEHEKPGKSLKEERADKKQKREDKRIIPGKCGPR